MRITVSVSGKFSMGYLWAAYLERHRMLDRLITPIPYRRGARFGVSRGRTHSLWAIGAANWAMQHAAPARVQPLNQIAVSAAYDEAASRMVGDCDIFNGWASMSLRSIHAARRRGIPSVLQIASCHIVTQTEILAEEARRWRVEPPPTHPVVVDRTVQEYEEADVLAVPAEFVRRTFIEQGVPASKIKLVPWGVYPLTPAAGQGKPSQRDRPDDVASASPRPLTILFVGAVGLRKGVPYLLEAFRKLDAPARLRLVGPVDRRFIRAIGGLPDRVDAVGVKTGDALAAEFRIADVFVLPSVEDGFGVVTTEALSAGLPAIVTTNCGSADAIRDGENGFVVPARDAVTLRDRMGLLLSDSELRLRMSDAAASSVRGWSWNESGDAHVREIYAPLLGEAREEAALARTA